MRHPGFWHRTPEIVSPSTDDANNSILILNLIPTRKTAEFLPLMLNCLRLRL